MFVHIRQMFEEQLAAEGQDDVRLDDLGSSRAERRQRRGFDIGCERQPVLFDDQNLVSGPRQQQRGKASGSAGANDHDPHSITPLNGRIRFSPGVRLPTDEDWL